MPNGGLGLALIRDGNGTRSFETLLRYRGAALAEFWRALRTLKALQAEQAAELAARAQPRRPALPCETDRRSAPNEPEGRDDRRLEDLGTEAASGRTLHEAPAPWMPKEPDRWPVGPAHARPDALRPDEHESAIPGIFGRPAWPVPSAPEEPFAPNPRARAAAGTRSLAGER